MILSCKYKTSAKKLRILRFVQACKTNATTTCICLVNLNYVVDLHKNDLTVSMANTFIMQCSQLRHIEKLYDSSQEGKTIRLTHIIK